MFFPLNQGSTRKKARHYGRRFVFIMPEGELKVYAEKLCATFEEAGLPVRRAQKTE